MLKRCIGWVDCAVKETTTSTTLQRQQQANEQLKQRQKQHSSYPRDACWIRCCCCCFFSVILLRAFVPFHHSVWYICFDHHLLYYHRFGFDVVSALSLNQLKLQICLYDCDQASLHSHKQGDRTRERDRMLHIHLFAHSEPLSDQSD